MFDLRKIRRELPFENVFYYDEICSTNESAADFVKKGKEDLIIAAKKQTSGRGRHDRVWHSPEGGLYFSFTRNTSKFDFPPHMTGISSAMGIIEYLKSENISNIEYRWPNDVLICGRKISGILMELVNQTVVIGIGVNVNNEEFPPDLIENSTSMKLLTGRSYELENVLIEIVKNVLSIKSSGEIIEFLKTSAMNGKRVVITTSEKKYNGIVAGFKSTGEIIINSDDIEMEFMAGDIKIIREEF